MKDKMIEELAIICLCFLIEDKIQSSMVITLFLPYQDRLHSPELLVKINPSSFELFLLYFFLYQWEKEQIFYFIEDVANTDKAYHRQKNYKAILKTRTSMSS